MYLFNVSSLCVLDFQDSLDFQDENSFHFFSLFQSKRLGSLNKFKAKARSILLATDVASRGLDIPHVDVVVNFDIPTHSKVSLVADLTFSPQIFSKRAVFFEAIVSICSSGWVAVWPRGSRVFILQNHQYSCLNCCYFTACINTLREYPVAWKQKLITEFINIYPVCFYEIYYINFLLWS